MKIADYTFNNNFKVVYAKDNSNPIICMQLYIRIGSALEAVTEAGFSHFTEHLVFKSTIKYPENSIMERVTFLGGQINAYTEYDSTCFYLTLASEFAKEGLEILAELVQRANCNEEQFQSEKKVIIEELKQYENEPEDNFIEQIASLYLKEHPYRNPIIGNRETIKKATKNKLDTFYQQYYTPGNSFLVVCGKFKEKELFASIEQHFGGWQDKPFSLPEIADESLPQNPAFFHIPNSINSDILAFAFPDLKETHPDCYAFSFGVKQFAIGKNSRLYKRLFYQEKLIDAIKVHTICGKYNGLSILMIFPKSKSDLQKIVDITIEEWKILIQYGLSETEITDQKKEYGFHYRFLYEYMESLAASLGNEELANSYQHFLSYPRKIESLTKQQIDTSLRVFLNLQHVYLFHSSKKPSIDFSKSLEYFTTSLPNFDYQRNQVLETILPNGIKLILKKVSGKPTIGIAASFNVSQLQETEKQLGINFLTSTLLLYGNQKRDHEQFMQFCNSQGISFSVAPEIETTTVKIKCFKKNVLSALELLSDVIVKPLFPEPHFQNIRQTIISNIDRLKDYPQNYAEYLWKKMIFGAQSSYLDKEGSKSSLRNISLSQVKKWHTTYFHPQNLTIAIVGDFPFEQVIQHLQYLIPVSAIPDVIKSAPVGIAKSSAFYKRTNFDVSQSYIHLGGFGCTSLESSKYTAFHVLAQIIGGDTNSILFNELREKTGFAYVVDFDFRATKQTGIFHAFTIVDKSNEKNAVSIIKDSLQRIQINGISKYELQKTINYIRGNRLLEEESVLSQASTIAKLEAIGFNYQYYLQRDERLRKVKLPLFKEIAKEYFKDDNFYIHVLG
jgi:zinc protease